MMGAGSRRDAEENNINKCSVKSLPTIFHQGSFLVTQAVAQSLVACGASKGSIITVGSIVGKVRLSHVP